MFIISAQGWNLKVVIWPMKKQDSLRSMVLTVAGILEAATSSLGYVLKRREHVAEFIGCHRLTQGQDDALQ